MGMLTYLVLMPTFTSIFQIYAMCNLHDISWGNRPAVVPGAAGTNQLTENAKKAALLKNEYMHFRVCFLFFWILCNFGYAVFIDGFVHARVDRRNCNDPGFLLIFSTILAIGIVYKVVFAAIHIGKMKFKYNSDEYHIDKVNLKKMRKELLKNNRESAVSLIPSDLIKDEDLRSLHDDTLLASYTPQDLKIRKALKAKANKERAKHEMMNKTVYVDDDDDDMDFQDADEEEQKDMAENPEYENFMVSKSNK